MIIRQLFVSSDLFYATWGFNKFSDVVFGSGLFQRLELRNDESILANLISERLFGPIGCSEFFKTTYGLLLLRGLSCRLILTCQTSLLIIILDIAIEIPNKDAISLTNTNNLAIVSRIE